MAETPAARSGAAVKWMRHDVWVLRRVVIEDGPTIEVHGRPEQGTRHNVLYGTLPGSDDSVVIKLERTAGALEREAAVLTALNTFRGVAPRLVLSGLAIVDGDRVPCLVIDRYEGSPPTKLDGWRRMGQAVGRLGNARPPSERLHVIDAVRFGQQHVQRVRELGERLRPLREAIPDWHTLASADVPLSLPLVITHGDPGPGNFLDDGLDGMLIDWEDAHVAPQGLDLARMQFIAMLGAGPAGYVARDHQARAAAATAGYDGALALPRNQSGPESRWWLTVAGIQFIHRRWQLGGPTAWEDAARVLFAALA